MNMKSIIGTVVGISVGLILVGSLLAPFINTFTGSTGALKEYKDIITAVMTVTIVAIMMAAVKLITSGRD